MSDQNLPDEYTPEDSLVNEEDSNEPSQLNFDPQANYYFRFAHDTTQFLRIINPPSSNHRRFTVSAFNQAQPQPFRYRFFRQGNTSNFHVQNSTFVANDRMIAFANVQQLAALAPGGLFTFTQVRNGIYQFHPNTNSRFVGLDNAITTNNPEVFARANYTPLEREWFITTDPFAPIPPIKPVEEGIYTIHTTRLPTSVIESPLRPAQESEPFIKRQDGTFTQLWQFVYDRQLNAYQIISYIDQCLFAYDSGIPGTPPRQRYRLRFTSRLNQTEASYWYVNPAGDGSYTIVSVKYPEQKFDLTLGITTDFNTVQLYEQNQYDAQNWLLKRVL